MTSEEAFAVTVLRQLKDLGVRARAKAQGAARVKLFIAAQALPQFAGGMWSAFTLTALIDVDGVICAWFLDEVQGRIVADGEGEDSLRAMLEAG